MGNKDAFSRIDIPLNILILVLFSLLLSGCFHSIRRDGPPNFYVDETKIANAVPKAEPLAKYGNMNKYWVFGRPYYPMKSARHYEAIGTASWYGTMFDKRRTSSGEPYNMLGMTAAHKTLPLPTYVEVTNLKNKRKIIVKVNDRGPFEGHRLIDLSYVAAKKLGMLGHGTAMVKVKAIDPYTYGRPIHLASRRKVNVHPISPEENYNNYSQTHSMYLQVGAFRHKANALKLQQRIASMFGTPVHVFNPSNKGKLYRVNIGPITDVATADQISSRLKNIGINPSKNNGV